MSNEGTIDALRFRKIGKGKVVKADKVLLLDERTILVKLDNGAFTVMGPGAHLNGNVAIANFGASEPSRAVLDGLVKMGVITSTERNRHIDHTKAQDKVRSDNNAAYHLQKYCEELGVMMPDLPEGVEPKRAYF